METISEVNNPLWLSVLRWTARVLALPQIIFLFMLLIGLATGSSSRSIPVSSVDHLLHIMWAFAMIGLVIGYWQERTGGLISAFAISTEYMILLAEGKVNSFITGLFVLLLVPSLLYLVCWYYGKYKIRE